MYQLYESIKYHNFNENNSVLMGYKYKLNEHVFENITPDVAWALGFIFTDGNIDNRLYALTIHIHKKDEDVLLKIKNIMGSTQEIKVDNRGYLYFRPCSAYMISTLIDIGCTPAKSKTLKFPTCIPENCMPHFLRGMFEGDGCISKFGQCSFVGSKDMCDGFKDILDAKDIKYRYHLHGQSKYAYYITISKLCEAYKFLQYIYDCSIESNRMNRKYDLYQSQIEHYQNVKSICRHEYTQEIRDDIYSAKARGISQSELRHKYPFIPSSTVNRWYHSRMQIGKH